MPREQHPVEPCDHTDCEDEGSEWEIVEGCWCYDHVPGLRSAPQEWWIEDE